MQSFDLKKRYLFVSFFVVGLINNNGYVLINSAAQNLAKTFHKENLMPVFQFSLSIFSVVVNIVNSKYLLAYKHKSKVTWIIIAWTIGYLGFFGAYHINNDNWGFLTCVIATLVIGIHTTGGSATVMGFMKALPPTVISGFASGTGFAGISGASINLTADVLDIPFKVICIAMIPISLIYGYFFFRVVDLKTKVDACEKENLPI